jgi:small redox-active disulfide protein 2
MKIQILGTGCPKCKKLALLVQETANEMGLDFELVKITNINEILEFGIMMTPGLAIDGEVKFAGKLPSKEELKKILT